MILKRGIWSAQRLVIHLHKMLKLLRCTIKADRMKTDYSEMLIDETSDTFSISEPWTAGWLQQVAE